MNEDKFINRVIWAASLAAILIILAALLGMVAKQAKAATCVRVEAGYRQCWNNAGYAKQYPPPKVRVRRNWRILGR